MALRCGLPHPDHLLRALNAHQLAELYAFLSLEPVDEGLQALAANWFALYANAHRDEKKWPQPFTPKDWLRDFDHEVMNEDAEARTDALKSLMRRLSDGNRRPTHR